MLLQPHTRLGPYEIIAGIAAGGMGEVYRAHDSRLHRDVAVKILPSHLSQDADRIHRFEQEARVVAALNHPNIVTIHDFGTHDRSPYLVSELLDGETLRSVLNRGPLTMGKCVDYARQIVNGLAAAHSKEIVHRDLKPENIIITPDGRIKILDFGLAKLKTAELPSEGPTMVTSPGVVMGTAGYMSPEQVLGSAMDHRTDLFSFGCVLFEMITGRRAFQRKTSVETMTSILNDDPLIHAAISGMNAAGLGRIVRRSLEKTPEQRFQSARDILFALDALVGLTVSASIGLARAETGAPPCLAVLPFANMSADPDAEFFSDGITEEILNSLAKLNGLRVIARTSSFAFKGKNTDIREIGRSLGAAHVLEGSVRRAGNRLRITAQLIDATNGHHLWSERYDRDLTDVFVVQDEITVAIRDELSKHLLGIGQVQSQAAPAIDPQTYEMFLRGRYLVDQRIEGMRQGMQLLQQVIERAPTYAPGHAALATAFSMLGFYCGLPSKDAFTIARGHAHRALALDSGNAVGLAAAGHAALHLDWDWPVAHTHYSRAAAAAPNYWAVVGLGNYLTSVGRFDEAIAGAKNGLSIDPLNTSAAVALALFQYEARRYADAIATCDKAIAIAPNYSEMHRWRGLALFESGRLEESLQSHMEAVRLSNRNIWAMMNLGCVYQKLGLTDEANAIFDEIERRAASEPVPYYALASRYLTTNRDRFFELMNQSVDAREFWNVMSRVEPWLDPDDPRFELLLKRIGIPQ
jgi:serine/threonine-protein kinase